MRLLVVQGLKFGDYFLSVGGRGLEQPASATPGSGDDDHLDVGGLASLSFDDGGWLIFGAGL
jgi:hypothetical protein